MGDSPEQLWKLLESYVGAEGLELDDVELLGQGKGRVLRVTVDHEAGLGVDRIATLSRGIGAVLDGEDVLDGPYTLEVSSPGLERKLRRPAHYRKSVGRQVKVKTKAPVEGAKIHRGLLEAADDEGVTVLVDGHKRRIAYGEVASAQTVFVWEKAAKPGGRP